jgi:hypothetical protein
MEPGGKKVACGMAKASLSKAKSLPRLQPGAAQLCGDGGQKLAVRRPALSTRPRKWFGVDLTMFFRPATLCCCGCDDLSGASAANSLCRTLTLMASCHLTVVWRRYLTLCFGIERKGGQ